ncbi:MAG: hypothetical protein NTV08_06875 [Verrucomicrobia bacterium]|nr:hypothetical protein [Verrucomicrobiota bacterium]
MKDIIEAVVGVIVSIGGGAAIVFAFSNWLGKLWADRLMSAEKAKHDRELESFRADIKRDAFQSEVRFTRLHEKQAEVIADLFTKLVALVDAADQHLIGPRVDPEKYKAYRDRETEFTSTFDRNQIYFASELCEALSNFASKLRRSSNKKWIWQDVQPETEPDRNEWRARLEAQSKLVTEEVPALKRQLTDEFRTLLGVHLYGNKRA